MVGTKDPNKGHAGSHRSIIEGVSNSVLTCINIGELGHIYNPHEGSRRGRRENESKDNLQDK